MNFSMWLPIWVIYLQQRRGLSLTQVTLIDAVFWITITLSEVPTGSVADTYGRKTSLAIGTGIQVFAAWLYGSAGNFGLLIAANLVWGIGLSFSSGAIEAFLYDTLVDNDQEEDYPHYAGRGRAISEGAGMVGALAGGAVAAFNLAWPFYGTAILTLMAFVIVLDFREPSAKARLEAAGPDNSYRATIQNSVKAMRTTPVLFYMMLYAAAMPVIGVIVTITLLQPHALGLGLGTALLGVLAVGVRGSSLAGSLSADRLIKHLGLRTSLLIAPTLIVFALLLLSLTRSLWSLILYTPVSFIIAAMRPQMENLVQKRVTANVRATIMSFQSLLFTLILAGTQPFIGFFADRLGIFAVYIIIAIGFSIIVLPTLILWLRIEPLQKEAKTLAG